MGKRYTGNENELDSGIINKINEDRTIDVYFETFQKRYFFLDNPDFRVKINDKVLVETQMGLGIGKVIGIKSGRVEEIFKKDYKSSG